MPRGGLFVVWQAKQIDFLMKRARQELNVTSPGSGRKGYLKLKGPGERFRYFVVCDTCDGYSMTVSYAKYAIRFLMDHAGHKTRVEDVTRDADDEIIENAEASRRERILEALGKGPLSDEEWDRIAGHIREGMRLQRELESEGVIEHDRVNRTFRLVAE